LIALRDQNDASDTVWKVEPLKFATPAGTMKIGTVDQPRIESITARISVTQFDGKMTARPGLLYRDTA
jgi:hypothetical protein